MTTLSRQNDIQSISCPDCVGKALDGFSVGNLLRRVRDTLRTRRQRRDAMVALHALSDYELRDIGISRSEIELAVNGDLRRHRA